MGRVFEAYRNSNATTLSGAAHELECEMRKLGGAAYPSQEAIQLEIFYNQARPFRAAELPTQLNAGSSGRSYVIPSGSSKAPVRH